MERGFSVTTRTDGSILRDATTARPGFPDEVWQAINVILLFLIGTIAAEDVAMKVRR